MFHKAIPIDDNGYTARLDTYILYHSPEIVSRLRPMILICPGGGYEKTSDREAEPIAIQFNAMGFHACVLRYSCKPAVFPTALRQLAKTVALIRNNAQSWNVDLNKIIILGFSAGGHLASSLGLFWNQDFWRTDLPLKEKEIKPNGLILCYPVISSSEEFSHFDSFRNLLGGSYGNEVCRKQVSLEKQMTKDMPKTFIWHTLEDATVPVENTLSFAAAMKKENIPFELHVFPKGAHGASLGTEETISTNGKHGIEESLQSWLYLAEKWLKQEFLFDVL